MKAFIFIALVASVAARNLDLDTIRLLKEKSLLTRPLTDDVLLKEKLINELPLERNVIDKVYPVENRINNLEGFKGLYDIENVDQVLTFDELYQTTLFREYLRLPLFREYIQYPAFQRYVASIYFQKFWQIPTFKQYFLNPVYFYKYIQPLVELFHSQYTPINNFFGQDDVLSQDNVYSRNMNVLPYVYQNRYAAPSSRFAGQYLPYQTETTNYKFLLDKIYKNLFNNNQFEQNIVPVQSVDTFVGQNVDDVLLLNVLLKKHIITPEIFETVIRGHVDLFTVLRQIYGKYIDLTDVTQLDTLLVKIFLHKNIITPEIYELVVRGQVTLSQLIRQIVGQHVDFNMITEKDVLLFKVLLKKNVITPEIYEMVIRGQVDLFTVLRQIYGQYFDFTTVANREVLLVKILLKENVITPEIYQMVVSGQIDLATVLRQIYGQYFDYNTFVNQRDVLDINDMITRRDVVDQYTIPTVNRFERLVNNDRFNNFNLEKMYKYNTVYNTELPTLRKNIFERLPLQKVLENNFA